MRIIFGVDIVLVGFELVRVQTRSLRCEDLKGLSFALIATLPCLLGAFGSYRILCLRDVIIAGCRY